MKNKFKPSDLSNFEENDFENLTFKDQKKYSSRDLEMLGLSDVSANSAFRSTERMRLAWSGLLMLYLIFFTIAMFTTFWFNGQCGILAIEKFCISKLSDTTLNFLITVGFVKVIGVVWIIVSHLFPHPRHSFSAKK
jgi:hypothetical protein